jgi:NADH:ubiquinone oxidoreductase subunit 2 (subunit N)
MWLGAPASKEKVPSSWALRTALALCCLFVLLLGIVPGGFVGIAQAAIRILSP